MLLSKQEVSNKREVRRKRKKEKKKGIGYAVFKARQRLL